MCTNNCYIYSQPGKAKASLDRQSSKTRTFVFAKQKNKIKSLIILVDA